MKSYLPKCCMLISSIFFLNASQAQVKENSIEHFIGTWKGSSLCQVKDSPCHDEVVVYYITKGNTADSCIIKANKIVNGVEEEMGTLYFKFAKANNELSSDAVNGKWNFKLKDGKMEGTLYARNALYRKIELSKIK